MAFIFMVLVEKNKEIQSRQFPEMDQTNAFTAYQPSTWLEIERVYRRKQWGEVPDKHKLHPGLISMNDLMVPLGTSNQSLPEYATETVETPSEIFAKIPNEVASAFTKWLATTRNPHPEGMARRAAFADWAVMYVSAFDQIQEGRYEVYYSYYDSYSYYVQYSYPYSYSYPY